MCRLYSAVHASLAKGSHAAFAVSPERGMGEILLLTMSNQRSAFYTPSERNLLNAEGAAQIE